MFHTLWPVVLWTMKIVLADRSCELTSLVEKGFREAGVDVERLDLGGLGDMIPLGTVLREMSRRFIGKDLAVYVTDELTFADGGGPYLRQVSSWAGARLVPVIVVASTCRISTRELRTLGVEAGYAVSDDQDIRRVVHTWVR